MRREGRRAVLKLSRTFLGLIGRVSRDIDIEQLRTDVSTFTARHPELKRRELAERLVSRTARRAAALGAVASLPPGWAAFATMGPELSTLIWLQSRMILGLHLLHGLEPEPEERSAEVLMGLAAGAGIRMGRSLGTRAAEELAERLVVRALGREGSRIVPVAGIAAGALLNFAAVRAVGRAVLSRVEKLALPEAPPRIVDAIGRVS
jgi:hypothetical protein